MESSSPITEAVRSTTDPPLSRCFPEIVDIVAGRVPVVVDSGFRRGSDIFKALAIGAKAVCLGRVPRWGLAAYGQQGAQRVLEILQNELVTTMAQAGRPTSPRLTAAPSEWNSHDASNRF